MNLKRFRTLAKIVPQSNLERKNLSQAKRQAVFQSSGTADSKKFHLKKFVTSLQNIKGKKQVMGKRKHSARKEKKDVVRKGGFFAYKPASLMPKVVLEESTAQKPAPHGGYYRENADNPTYFQKGGEL